MQTVIHLRKRIALFAAHFGTGRSCTFNLSVCPLRPSVKTGCSTKFRLPNYCRGKLLDINIEGEGIGSKLMAKMGYVVGQGLGKEGCGRTEPVPIQLIPQGKSLDKIMELKELAGDQDLFDAMKKEKKKAKKQEEKNKAAYNKIPAANIFDFINKKLGGKRGDVKSLVRHHKDTKKEPAKHISERDLHAKSDRGINVQLFKTHEEMKNVEKELVRLRQGLSRNENKDRGAAERIRQKIQTTEAYLQKLKSSEQAIESHKQKRSDKKKLTIF